MDCGMLYGRRSIFNRHLPDEFLVEKLQKKIQIFASDISEKAIKKARAEFILKLMLEYFLRHDSKNYFTKNGDGYE
jgi:two-component system CheB/CheR fusion protein